MNTIFEAGRRGKGSRADCWIGFQEKSSGGIKIELTSKVAALYGDAIRQTLTQGLQVLGVEHAYLEVEDYGALPFCLMARLEAAVQRARPELDKTWLPPMRPACQQPSQRERLRRSRLYLPGSQPKYFINAGLHQPDGIILDLEDSVHPEEKDSARVLVRNALRAVDFYGAERMVRINQLPLGLEDLAAVIAHNVHVILIPKCEDAEMVRTVDAMITELSQGQSYGRDVFLMPIIESALGVVNAYQIAKACPRVVALTIGLEDYTADLGTARTQEGRESFVARSQVVNAARAAGVQPIDTVFSDVGDMAGLRQAVLEAKSLGFEGKGCIHPRQIAVVHEAFAPTAAELAKAQRIVLAYEQAQQEGRGVIAVGNKMIDPPVVKRALHTVKLAEQSGQLAANWREEVQHGQIS